MGPQEVSYTKWIYDNFSYTESGVTTPLDGSAYHVFTSGTHCSPPPTNGPNPYPLQLPFGAKIYFKMTGRGLASAYASTLVDPMYKVLSILYATPGNFSSNAFTNTTTNGTVTTIGQSFTESFSETFGFGWSLASTSMTLGASTTTGHSDAFTETFANASAVSNASATSGPNTINHNQDMFLIWLNPEVELVFPASDYSYFLHTQYQNGVEEQPDMIEITAEAMQSNNGSTNIPLAILQRQYDPATGQYDLPGLYT